MFPPCAVPLVSNLSLRPTEHLWGPGRRKPRATGLHASNQPNPIWMRFLTNKGGNDDEEKENQRRLQIVMNKARTTSHLIPSQGASETGV